MCTVHKALTSVTPRIFLRVSVCTVDKALTSVTPGKLSAIYIAKSHILLFIASLQLSLSINDSIMR